MNCSMMPLHHHHLKNCVAGILTLLRQPCSSLSKPRLIAIAYMPHHKLNHFLVKHDLHWSCLIYHVLSPFPKTSFTISPPKYVFIRYATKQSQPNASKDSVGMTYLTEKREHLTLDPTICRRTNY